MRRAGLSRLFVALAALVLALSAMPALAEGMPAKAATDAKLSAAMDCGALARLDFRDIPGAPTVIASAQVAPATATQAEYCEVKGLIQPQIAFTLRLPTKSWNGRYFQTGCGFFCGVVNIESCADAQAKDFAVAAQNMGHVGASASDSIWASDPALREDFGKRSTHVTSLAAKAILTAYYGKSPAFSYYRGCSTGGREGLSEVQFYPDDFDGVIAGDPAFPGRQGGIANVWDTRLLTREDGSNVFTPEKLKVLNQAVLAKCDGLDGLKDGIIVDPRVCVFDVTKLKCKGSDGADCLTSEQVAAALELYRGPHDSKGTKLVPGHRLFGSEMAWESGTRAPIADGYLRYMAFEQNPPGAYRIWDLDWNHDVPKLEAMAKVYDPVAPYGRPDLAAFHARGGKLLIYHGFADPTVSALNTIDYYADVTDGGGGLEATKTWARLFLIPGMFHCRGGDAPNTFDMLTPMMAWVEKGVAPESVLLTQLDAAGKVMRTRPAFAYPAVPKYKGKGDVNDAANFAEVTPKGPLNDHIAWNWSPK